MSSGSEAPGPAEPSLSPGERRRSLIAVIACVSVAALTQGLTWPLLGLMLEREGASAAFNGLNATAQSLAVFAVSPFAGAVVARFGMVPTATLALVLEAVLFLAFPLVEPGVLWLPLRFLIGMGSATLYILSETWINQIAPDHARGRVLAIYGTLWAAGFGIGPLIIIVTGSEGWPPFLAGAGLLLLAVPPLAFARRLVPRLAREPGASFAGVVRRAPVAILCMLMFGFVDAAMVSLLAVYAVRIGLDTDAAVALVATLLIGSVVSQLPAGWIADRMDRGRLLLATVATMTVAALVVALAAGSPLLLWPTVFALGAAIGATYLVTIVLVGERFRGRDLAAANAVRASAWSVGSIFGPPAAGAAMETIGAVGLPVTAALACAAFLAYATFARIGKGR